MKILTDTARVRRNRRWAQNTFLLSMGIWLTGLVITLLPLFNARYASAQYAWLQLIPSVVLPIGLVVALFAVGLTNRWVREPRPETALRDGLKGLSNKSRLYHYYRTTDPAQHVLVSPQGVFAVVTRYQKGQFVVKGDRVRNPRGPLQALLGIFRMDGVGHPVYEARRAADRVQKLLAQAAPGVDVVVEPVIAFLDPTATLVFDGDPPPDVAFVFTDEKHPQSFKNLLRAQPSTGKMLLRDADLAAFEQLLGGAKVTNASAPA